jgi:hypothetical protein
MKKRHEKKATTFKSLLRIQIQKKETIFFACNYISMQLYNVFQCIIIYQEHLQN